MTFLQCGKLSYSGLGIAQIKLRGLYGALEHSKTRLQTRTVGMVRALYILEYQSGCLRSVSALISHDWGRFLCSCQSPNGQSR